MEQQNKDLTLEVNPRHPIMIKINKLRKTDTKIATLIVR